MSISDCLIVVPTTMERSLLMEALQHRGIRYPIECCGFGLVAAAARTAQLLTSRPIRRVLLVGIAGGLTPELSVGSAWHFTHVACHGIGAGSAAAFVPAGRLGWSQIESIDGDTVVGDVLPLGGDACGSAPSTASSKGLLLSCCASSASADDVHDRLRLFPGAVAEDMEGFGVAMACRLVGAPLTIVRGISNIAGDRDTRQWRIRESLAAAADLTSLLLGGQAGFTT